MFGEVVEVGCDISICLVIVGAVVLAARGIHLGESEVGVTREFGIGVTVLAILAGGAFIALGWGISDSGEWEHVQQPFYAISSIGAGLACLSLPALIASITAAFVAVDARTLRRNTALLAIGLPLVTVSGTLIQAVVPAIGVMLGYASGEHRMIVEAGFEFGAMLAVFFASLLYLAWRGRRAFTRPN